MLPPGAREGDPSVERAMAHVSRVSEGDSSCPVGVVQL